LRFSKDGEGEMPASAFTPRGVSSGLILDKYQPGTKTAVKRIQSLNQLCDAQTQKRSETDW